MSNISTNKVGERPYSEHLGKITQLKIALKQSLPLFIQNFVFV